MYTSTKDIVLPTTITGSLPRPAWFTENLAGRPFRAAMTDAKFREQYLDGVSAAIRDQERAGLDIVSDGDARFDIDVGGRSWMGYVPDRLGGMSPEERSQGPVSGRHGSMPSGSSPGDILFEVREARMLPVVSGKLGPGPLEFAQLWRAAQQMTEKPVKIGCISPEQLANFLINRFYEDEDEIFDDLADILNGEFHRVADSGAALFQVEEPCTHRVEFTEPDADAKARRSVEIFNRSVAGLRDKLEVWCHTCWGNPAQQRTYDPNKRYDPALEYMNELDADVLTFECASTGGRDIEAIGKKITKPKIAIGVIDHHTLQVERPEEVAALIRKALETIPAERLVISTDCGFGREGMSRRHAFYKMVSLARGTNIVRKELGVPEAYIAATDAAFALEDVG
ncbi:MAG: cobalamin-independent methionine synthase II family protein [bacterium]